MSMERALIQQTRTEAVPSRARAIVQAEATKGCRAELSPQPVALEPPFRSLAPPIDPESLREQPGWIVEPPTAPEGLVRLRVWISPRYEPRWRASEMFLRQLHGLRHRLGFEIAGHGAEASVRLLVHRDDVGIVQCSFAGAFPHCSLEPMRADPLAEAADTHAGACCFYDYIPPPPYSHQVTRPEELPVSPLITLLQAMARTPPGVQVLYQVLLQPVDPAHDWHRNVQTLLDLEFMIRSQAGADLPSRHLQQMPSGDLREMAGDVTVKAHDDKVFFFAALRVVAIGPEAVPEPYVRALDAFRGAIQHQGRPFGWLDQHDYRQLLDADGLRELFLLGRTHRPGFLVNTAELSSLVHLPRIDLEEARPLIQPLETLPADPSLDGGCWIGDCHYGTQQQRVGINHRLRRQQVHLIGGSGQGKSSLMERIIHDDILRGDGVAVLDPHGDLVQSVLDALPESELDRVVYLDWSDEAWVPIWNPLGEGEGVTRGRLAEEIVGAFKSFVDGWGDRLEHLLRFTILGLLHLPEPSLLDVANALRPKSQEGKQLRDQVLAVVRSPRVRAFWKEDLLKYAASELGPPQHKLSKLLADGPLCAMFSQPESRFSLRQIMRERRILLVDLTAFAAETRNVVGSLCLSLLHTTALGRSREAPEDRQPFHIHVDEAHRFVTDALEDIIAETRKYGVSLLIAHQQMSQLSRKKGDALEGVGSTLIFRVNTPDAQHLVRGLRKQVEVDDILRLACGEAIARIGGHITRIRTRYEPVEASAKRRAIRQRVIESCRHRYYRRSDELLAAEHPPPPAASALPEEIGELIYDEFDDIEPGDQAGGG
ncbi:MAG: type IV secretion system DNA-binding domain-containing protein [Phycisphaeraceae bacterium]